ncbi:UNVERIFIED_CONTAM: Synaptotagmin-1 [Sesamum calycinum]|uniref:Synaptotagmin-1 n=1 Tax=Sesamum calycinum TaxID=2727403 RepID=A0AAW2P6L0_9LAMI
MGIISTVLGVFGFGIGVAIGLVIGYFLFIYQPTDVKDPEIRPLVEKDSKSLQQLLPEIPIWIKNPDYDRVDWLNKFIEYMWPYLDKAICKMAKKIAEPIIAEQIPKYKIDSVEFETLTLGCLPPTFEGMKVYNTEEKELIMELGLKWAANPNILVAVKAFGLRATVQVLDLQVFACPRITLKPLVPSFPCFANIHVSLMEKPHVDFGVKLLGADAMSIPGAYRFVQEIIKDQVANMYLWPKRLEVQIMDPAKAMKKPVGILHVNVVRAMKLRKKDLLGASDPYVKLKLSEDKLPSKKTTVKHKNLNPEWNEEFTFVVKDPEAQVLELVVYDWEQVVKKNRDPRWEEEFQFMLDEPPHNDRVHVEVLSTSKRSLLHAKETLGYVDIYLSDVVSNKRINERYHLIDSKNGRIQIEMQWRTAS